MGMAASQARYLALVARKSNCEYEGQQINQARTALSNQSANLFNQMLGLQVPVPPSTQDFTKTQYSFKDGENASTISSWQQLATPEEDYNYVVTHHYYTDVYTGSEKKLTDPQVQMKENTVSLADVQALRTQVTFAESELQRAQNANKEAEVAYQQAAKELANAQNEAADLNNYATLNEGIQSCTYDENTKEFTITNADGSTTNYIPYNSLADKSNADGIINALITNNALKESDKDSLYFTEDGTSFARQSDLFNLQIAGSGTLNTYNSGNANTLSTKVSNASLTLNVAEMYSSNTLTELENAQTAYDNAITNYNEAEHPEYIGNCKLTALASLTKDQEAELNQVVADLEANGITADISDCFDENGNYLGGIYEFKLNGTTYYTTYNDLYNSYQSGTGINNIDGQVKMPYYNASYVSTKIEETEKALLETDGNGRFVSVRLENDSITYTLNMETVTDDVAYQDAMNKYYYENAIYDKTIQDINAKTSIIQRQDQQLELRLKQLDTERNALSTEIDAVSSVVKDNVEKSFKTFGG